MTILKRLLTGALFSSAMLVFTTGAWASPITFTLQGAKFSDMTAVTGSFKFNPITSTYSEIAITTSRATYDIIWPNILSSADGLVAIDSTNPNVMSNFNRLSLTFNPGLTSQIPRITFIHEAVCQIATCNILRFGRGAGPSTAGKLIAGATVPEPSTYLLFGSGLLSLAGYRWQQRRREGTQLG